MDGIKSIIAIIKLTKAGLDEVVRIAGLIGKDTRASRTTIAFNHGAYDHKSCISRIEVYQRGTRAGIGFTPEMFFYF
jgi:hypothetical protein